MNNVDLVKNVYAALAKGDVPAVLASFDPQIEWREAENNPYSPKGDPWFGCDAVTQNLLAKLATEWDGFAVHPKTYHDANPSVIVEGRYTGKYKATGKNVDMQFCHIWKISNGKLKSFQQYCDTAQIQEAAGVHL